MSDETHSRFIPDGLTRDCLDPWIYVEVKVDGAVSLCCVRRPVGNLARQSLAHILHSDHARALRRDLLTGKPDAVCRNCGLRGVTTPANLRRKVAALRDSLHTPEGFDAAAYLEANPDVRDAGLDPVRHYLDWGRIEGRPLRPQVPAPAGREGGGPRLVAVATGRDRAPPLPSEVSQKVRRRGAA